MNGIELFDKTSLECNKLITNRYSTSFTLGIKLLDKKFHSPVYAVYGFVRYADEIVDTFLNSDRKSLLKGFKNDTYEAIDSGVSFNPVLHAFQLIVNKHKIDKNLIEAFFHSMEMDLVTKTYDESKYREYIYGSAEVIGLMCLKIFCEGDDKLYNDLSEPARKLGAAFQKVNFLRDIKSDFEECGRVYFPDVDYNNFDENSKKKIEEDIQKDFDEALIGIDKLPVGAEPGVRIAYNYYQTLFDKIKSLSPQVLTQKRVRISNFHKFLILLSEKYLYLTINIFIISCTLPTSFDSRVNYYSKWYALFPAIIITAFFFIIWDSLFTGAGIWSFNPRHTSGYCFLNLPIEEWMFFFTVPYSCVFIYEVVNYISPPDILGVLSLQIFYFIILFLIAVGIYGRDKTYTWINSVVAVTILVAHYIVFGQRFLGRFFLALALHYIPFILFNSVMTGGLKKGQPVVFYNTKKILNINIGTIPIEDAIYSMSLLLMNISIFEYIQDIVSGKVI